MELERWVGVELVVGWSGASGWLEWLQWVVGVSGGFVAELLLEFRCG